MKLLLTTALVIGLTSVAFAGGPEQDQPVQDKPVQDQPTQDKPSRDPAKCEAAEIHIFMNYKAPSHYDEKLISTVEKPLSAEPLYYDWNDATPANGACFKGDPDAALTLFEDMVKIMNHDNGLRIAITGSSYYDEDTHAQALEIWAYDHATRQDWNWFPRLRRCAL